MNICIFGSVIVFGGIFTLYSYNPDKHLRINEHKNEIYAEDEPKYIAFYLICGGGIVYICTLYMFSKWLSKKPVLHIPDLESSGYIEQNDALRRRHRMLSHVSLNIETSDC